MCYAGFVINKAPSETMSAPLSGRQAEARRNDGLILEAAREVFVEDPDAPISAVAERAGVGIGALYRRYASKEELRACGDTSPRPRPRWPTKTTLGPPSRPSCGESWTPTHTRSRYV
jgi:hypothetical protein